MCDRGVSLLPNVAALDPDGDWCLSTADLSKALFIREDIADVFRAACALDCRLPLDAPLVPLAGLIRNGSRVLARLFTMAGALWLYQHNRQPRQHLRFFGVCRYAAGLSPVAPTA